MKKIRCAIYTRKSTEEGLEQDFNSLDAQREACISYITSQKHEGWVLIDDERFEDGGISGGTLERPGLQKLMGRIDEGSIDQIVVYKIDRLTRSLSDFAKLVERLEQANASFVSVTQSFNTSTSMGRLTLNVLLSFAQFEREVTAERIRDKIAASKKKGLWMGGTVPYGYKPENRTLLIVEEEAEVIRELFNLYLTLGALRLVSEEAERRGFRTKTRTLSSGRKRGGHLMTKSYIHAVLTNPIYRGQIRHGKKIYQGQHKAIIDSETWNKVQKRLKVQRVKQDRYGTKKTKSLLCSKLYDETGDRLTPSHGQARRNKKYRYYVSHRLITSTKAQHSDGWRIPAIELEEQIAREVIKHIKDNQAQILNLTDNLPALEKAQNQINQTISTRETCWLVKRGDIKPQHLTIQLNSTNIATWLELKEHHINSDHLSFTTSFITKRRGIQTKLIIGNKPKDLDTTLLKNIALAIKWYSLIKQGKNYSEIGEIDDVSIKKVSKTVKLAFLYPDLIRGIITGEQEAHISSEYFKNKSIPIDWDKQQKLFSNPS